MGGGGERLCPVGGRHGGLKEERAGDIVDGADRTFSLAVLGGCVRAREAKADAVLGEEGGDGGVYEFRAVIRLHGNDGTRELSAGIGDEICEMCSGVRFLAQGKGPHKMRIVINNHEIVFEAGITKHGRCPKITVYQCKRSGTYCMGPSEGQAHMFAKLTSMANM